MLPNRNGFINRAETVTEHFINSAQPALSPAVAALNAFRIESVPAQTAAEFELFDEFYRVEKHRPTAY